MMANYRWITVENRSNTEIQHPMFVEDLEKIKLTEEEMEETRKCNSIRIWKRKHQCAFRSEQRKYY